MATFQGGTRDPFQGFRYRVVVPGFGGVAGFQNVTGLAEETELVEYREGNDPSTMRKLPGLTSFDNITLEKGVGADVIFQLWRLEILDIARGNDGLPQPQVLNALGSIKEFRRDIEIQLFDKGQNFNANEAVVRWVIRDAWPVRLEYGDLDASSSDVLVETLELANEGIFRVVSA